MGFFEKIFKKPNIRADNYFQTLNGYTPVFTTHEGGVYEAELCRAAIHAFATHASKLQPEIVGNAYKELANKLKFKPNPFMSTSQFLYRVATILSVNNTAFIVPIEDDSGYITGYYPVLPQRSELLDVNGTPYFRYTFGNGKKACIEFEKVGVLTSYQYRDDVFGESNAALKPTMDLIAVQNQGIVEGVKNAASFRFMAKVTNFAFSDDIKKERQKFTADNFSSDNNGGMLLFPNTYTDIKQIESKPFIVDKDQMAIIQNNVFNYFGVNEDVLQNKTIGDSWSAFYEGKIEPFSLQLSLAMTNMTYTPREIATGNQILFTANRMQYMSNQDKLSVSAQMFDRGLMNRNQINEIWNLPPVEDGDKYYIRRDYIEVSKLGGDTVDN